MKQKADRWAVCGGGLVDLPNPQVGFRVECGAGASADHGALRYQPSGGGISRGADDGAAGERDVLILAPGAGGIRAVFAVHREPSVLEIVGGVGELAKAGEVKGILDSYKIKENSDSVLSQEETVKQQNRVFSNFKSIITNGYYNDPGELRTMLESIKSLEDVKGELKPNKNPSYI